MMRLSAAILLLSVFAVLPAEKAQAAGKCVHIVRQGNYEVMVNRCKVCMVTAIFRSRPGNEVPVNREYNVQAHSDFPVPFKGPGSTRIQSERPCTGEIGSQPELPKSLEQAKADPTCITLERAPGGVTLMNSCTQCRAVAIERVSADGSRRNRDYMMLAGKANMPVAAQGFAQVGLLGEIACPAN